MIDKERQYSMGQWLSNFTLYLNHLKCLIEFSFWVLHRSSNSTDLDGGMGLTDITTASAAADNDDNNEDDDNNDDDDG